MAVNDNPLYPPEELVCRMVYTPIDAECTVSIPSDSQQLTSSVPKWFTSGGSPAMQPLREGNEVLSIIDGEDTFRLMHAAITTANAEGHFIYLLGWFLDLDVNLNPSIPKSTVRELLVAASTKKVQIRVMLWDQVGTQNTTEVANINTIVNGAAILDNRTLNLGSHHQKVLIIKGSEGLIAFCGGVDINPDRIRSISTGSGSPLHDVHCQIKGPATFDLLNIFQVRWLDHPNHVALDSAKGPLLSLSEPVPANLPGGKHFVQIARTFSNGNAHPGIGPGPSGYSFAPMGEQTIWRQINHAISEARQFIYIEDQYLVDMRASRALEAALPNIKHLTILIPHGSISDLPQVNYRRRAFIAPLRRAGGAKVRVFFLSPAGDPHTYVHAKTLIFDDEFAIIGSANCNRRGYTHDSEVNAGIFDISSDAELSTFFARSLRIKLWAEHLNMVTPAGNAALFDGVASAIHWLSPPAGAHITPYDETVDIETIHSDFAWNNTEDPDGS